MAEPTVTAREGAYVNRLLSSMRLSAPQVREPMVQENLSPLTKDVNAENRFLSSLAALVFNVGAEDRKFDRGRVQALSQQIDELIDAQINEILHHPEFQATESAWRGLDDLVQHTNFKAGIAIDLLDVAKEELHEDFENNASYIFGGALFQKVYIAEYDQYGGRPFGAIIGVYEFQHTPQDLFWLRNMAKVANASHAPFLGAVSPRFFNCASVDEVEAIKDLEGLLSQPKYGAWNALRDSDEAAYIGLTFPRYVLRLPWNPETNPCNHVHFTEVAQGQGDNYLWGNSVFLMARNMIRSFGTTGWCQYIRGPKGGGQIQGLPVDTFTLRGQDEIRAPVEIAIPDYRELEFSRSGFMPLIYKKGSAEASFFSAQSIKRPKRFMDPKDSQNSQMVCNMSYTLSVTRIAHYVKSIMRDNIGSAADGPYIQTILNNWISKCVTTVVEPDNLTLRHYPFKAASVTVTERPADIGWYDCSIAVLPHRQFEGMNVELRIDSRLG